MTENGREQQSAREFVPDNPLGHAGELGMRARFPSQYDWDEHSLAAMMSPVIQTSLARFIEAVPFFFIATASPEGHCDCSFRGREQDASGNLLPAVRVLDRNRLVFPDFSGNGLYNSLGNMLINPHIGMLFIDFERQRRARINGIARIVAANAEFGSIWPTAQAAVLVTVEQAYRNCSARIPRMRLADGHGKVAPRGTS
ncbi:MULTISPECIES: pyridoxamine 5'-phosphate oxidase family protein [Alphaproteobacteria]|uniref:Hydrolase n=2 Tax=Alphaproteobacteria TaxID=28211 RepID=A0A512HH98_9HYPH|nr:MULTISPECIES: pyridoxamine 5'-phosphate oxidase family protein [Alphaproteobacteria]GEO84823.1 hydrolase [Ciceribacter naphthalenivorans]GLR20556.1 hydrolase [Ciceribacter naphthalenivorans]GLT03412.1 hydrolase [Sphingomonas psychrolutea]